MEESGCSAESRMGTLYDPSARTAHLALPTSSASIPVTPEPQTNGILKTVYSLKMSERCWVHPRSVGVNIICAAFDFCLLTILWVRLSSLCLISLLTEIELCAIFDCTCIYYYSSSCLCYNDSLYELHLMNFCIGELTQKGLAALEIVLQSTYKYLIFSPLKYY